MNKSVPTGMFRILGTTGLCLALAFPAQAATWQWSAPAGRERLELRLNPGVQERSTVRTGPTTLEIELSGTPGELSQQGSVPGASSLIAGVEAAGNAVRLTLRNPEFGYIVQRRNGRLVLEVFADKLGARWQPSDRQAVRPPTPQAQTTPPAPPTTGTAGTTTQAAGQPAGQSAPQDRGQIAAPSGQTPPASSSGPTSPTGQTGTASTGTATAPAPAGQIRGGISAQTVAPGGQTPTAPVGASQTTSPAMSPVAPQAQAGQALRQQGQQPAGVRPPQSGAQSGPQPGLTARSGNAVGSGTASSPSAPATTTPAAAPEGNDVRMPMGMPGAVNNPPDSALSVPSGSSMPVQKDPASSLPSAEVLGAMTRKIEQLPVTPEPAVPLSPAEAAMLSSPVAPPAPVEPAAPATDATPVAAQEAPPSPEKPETTGEQGNQGDRLISGTGNGLRARLNASGPDAWPSEQGINSTSRDATGARVVDKPVESAVVGSVKPLPGAHKPEAAKDKKDAKPESQVIYVDEQGNPVPKPVDVNQQLEEARKLIQSLQFPQAEELLQNLKNVPMPLEKREETLYLLSDAITGRFNGQWLEGFESIVKSTSEAMNANLRSPQVARALERLGMINLRTGNQQDAAGYFGVLRRQFPTDPKVAECYYALGMDQLKNGQYAEAVQSFQVVMSDYPESRSVRDAARFMAEALYKQGHYERAMTIIDFVDRRWPRIYIDDPSYLLMVADTQFRRGRLEDALQTYWIYYNLRPNEPDNAQLMLNVGTIYLLQGDKGSARTMYHELLRRFPDSPYAPVAVMREGEEGIFEGNLTLEDLFAMFARPNLSTLPEIAYERLIKDYPQSSEAVTAALRLAAWKLWNREYPAAMEAAEGFINAHPDSPLTARADEIILRAFAIELAMDLGEQNYDRILQRWERFPQVRGAYAQPDDELRVALARAQLNRGNEAQGFELLNDFLVRKQDAKYGEYVYKLNLARALRNEDWKAILSLGERVADWNLPQSERNNLIYSMAIAHENLGQGQLAIPLWAQLYTRDDIPLYQKAYATYFMARDAERRRNIEEAYQLNKDTLNLFTRLDEERSDRADPERVRESLVSLMDVTEVANRFAESLDWAEKYAPFVPDDSPEYAAFRFRLARLHRKMGNLAKWQSLLEEIVRREPESVFGRMAASELRTYQVARDLTRFAAPPAAPPAAAPTTPPAAPQQ